MKFPTYAFVLIATLLSANSAIANDVQRYWFYETAVEEPVKSGYTVRLKEDKNHCESSAVVASETVREKKQEAIFTCIYEKGWKLSTASAMQERDGYFIIDLCVYKEGKIIAVSYFECRKEGALPFTMAYASSFSPEKALSDAITRFEILRGGGSLP